jgi:hypothetical protein
MALWDDMFKGFGPSLLIGVGIALVAPVLLPAVASLVRPLAKGVVKGGLTLADKAKEFAAEAGEQVSDLVAEAKAEHYSKGS